ncbi:DUF3301 domain-containing protein [Francisella adeliensis]|uniref:DUF3301 domain-containing protein n=1 Tax=Francisella adeliensis TaxID=2007306 RepID=A0A2Z4XZK1_9GAMM|nr:DUF3301 domain-containing protein [Francisella adeliensis]AXA34096.1 hypothetical protein CDH04_06600 [Francisella adeliensis]MBK2085263.1 DUF3301 domain-containing protein [Francisella adeliensis]MBK2095969.1 DUF3301 domain-containing protein [Francisella adeliensis]QIW12337.1 DUF3301 domain-containing protein [Francisella adeliensis]QIW14211.1 DUF3301 domain-containing protein [Francisella adeliensis]
MSVALYTLIFLGICFFTWRNFMKNKEYTIGIAERYAKKHNIEMLDDTVCLRKISVKVEFKKLVFYRVYSFDYNTAISDDRYRAYIVLKNGKFDELIMSEFEKADLERENVVAEQTEQENEKPQRRAANNIISFED